MATSSTCNRTSLLALAPATTTKRVLTDSTEILLQAILLVSIDDGFSLPSVSAVNARELAHKFEAWLMEDRKNRLTLDKFAEELIIMLKACLPKDLLTRKSKKIREKMWEEYYKLRSSTGFTAFWKELLMPLEANPTPIFYQFVTDKVMEDLIKVHFVFNDDKGLAEETSTAIDHDTADTTSSAGLDYEERNALRYTAGYVLKSLLKKMERKSNGNAENKAVIINYLKQIIDEEIGTEDDRIGFK